MRVFLPMLLVGCGGPALREALAPAQVDVQLEVVDPQVASGEPVEIVVHGWTSGDWELPPLVPGVQAPGVDENAPPELVLRRVSEEGPVSDGGREHRIHRYALDAPDGSYIVGLPELEAAGSGDAVRTIEVPPVFVDVGVPPPVAGDMGELAVAPPPEPAPVWPWVAVGAGVLLAGGIAAWLVHRRRNRPPPPPVPAHVRAQRAWEQARREHVVESDLAQALSEVLRRYLEDISGWPATARTTREIDGFLAAERLLDRDHRARARRILDATDRLKYAREGGGSGFFERMDEDFAAVIQATTAAGEAVASAEEGADA
jgi:hypothetical protein